MRKITIAGLAAAALIAGACGAGSSVKESDDAPAATGSTAASAPAKKSGGAVAIGKTLTVNANGSVTNWTVTKAEARTTADYGMTADNGKWVLVHVKAAVKSGPEVFVNPGDISVIAKSGKVYETTIGVFKGHPMFNGATVAPGQSADGWVVFDVAPADIKGARIQLKQMSLLDDTAFGYWNLTL
jgi:hypothetical protein